MAKYVDGYVLAVPKDKLEEYRKMAEEGAKIWKKYGALEYFECAGDDLDPKSEGMELMKFPEVLKTKSDETVIFSFVVFESRAHRDQVNSKVMSDPFMDQYKDKPMPFDTKRMVYGGFNAIVES